MPTESFVAGPEGVERVLMLLVLFIAFACFVVLSLVTPGVQRLLPVGLAVWVLAQMLPTLGAR